MIKVSVLIVTYKRETLLLNCLHSLRQLKDSFELQVILVSNGNKLSPELTSGLKEQFENLTILEVERLTPGRARNLALAHVTGEWVFFIDDDAILPTDYGIKAKLLLEENPLWESFGGPDTMPEHSDLFQTSLAIALSSPLCTGPTFRRHSPKNKESYRGSEKDLTSCHLWARAQVIKEKKILFAEEFHRGEETTFLQDLKKAGVDLWVVPSLWLFHERRKKFSELLRPLFYGGYYRSHITASFLTPFSLPSIMLLMHLLLFVSLPLFIILGEIYFLIIAGMSFFLCFKHKKLNSTPLVIVLHYIIVMLYGAGFLYQRIQRLTKKAL